VVCGGENEIPAANCEHMFQFAVIAVKRLVVVGIDYTLPM
jgi:hypothetical protein